MKAIAQEPQPKRESEEIGGGLKNHTILNPSFTGIARSVQSHRNGEHCEFQILTLYVEKGRVTKMDVSDSYKSFEAQDRLNLVSDIATLNLNMNWKDGEAWRK